MNLQEVFDKIYAATRKQKAKAEDAQGFCVFITRNGARCFMGMLLTEKQAHEAQSDAWNTSRIAAEIGLVDSVEVLFELMKIHDTGDPGTWDTRIAELASKSGVAYPPKAAAT